MEEEEVREGEAAPLRSSSFFLRFLFAGVSSDEVFRLMKDVTAVANTATEEVTKLADKKKAEIEAA